MFEASNFSRSFSDETKTAIQTYGTDYNNSMLDVTTMADADALLIEEYESAVEAIQELIDRQPLNDDEKIDLALMLTIVANADPATDVPHVALGKPIPEKDMTFAELRDENDISIKIGYENSYYTTIETDAGVEIRRWDNSCANIEGRINDSEWRNANIKVIKESFAE